MSLIAFDLATGLRGKDKDAFAWGMCALARRAGWVIHLGYDSEIRGFDHQHVVYVSTPVGQISQHVSRAVADRVSRWGVPWADSSIWDRGDHYPRITRLVSLYPSIFAEGVAIREKVLRRIAACRAAGDPLASGAGPCSRARNLLASIGDARLDAYSRLGAMIECGAPQIERLRVRQILGISGAALRRFIYLWHGDLDPEVTSLASECGLRLSVRADGLYASDKRGRAAKICGGFDGA